LRAARVLQESFSTASLPNPADALQSAGRMYGTSGGYLQTEVDSKAVELIGILQAKLQDSIKSLQANSGLPADRRSAISIEVKVKGGDWPPIRPDHRRPIPSFGNRVVYLEAASAAPADASTTINVGVSLPQDSRPGDVFVLDCPSPTDKVEIPLGEFMDGISLEAEILIALFADRLISHVIAKIEAGGRKSLRSKGYT
jgi:hypothetical protein